MTKLLRRIGPALLAMAALCAAFGMPAGAQPGKHDAGYQTARNFMELTEIDPQERIRRLHSRPSGRLEGPAGLGKPQ